MNKQSEQGEYGRSEITSESFRQSSLRSSWRSISRASSRGSSRQSFALTFGLPLGISSRDHVVDDPEEILPVENAPEVPLSRLAALNKPEIPALVLGTIVACVNGVIMPIYALLLSQAIKIFYESHHKLRKDSKFWSLMFLALGLASVLINPVRSYFFAVAGSKLIQRIRAICFEKVVNMEIGWFDFPEHSTGAISARLSTDAAIIRSLVGDQLAATVQNIATVAAAMIIAFTASWQLALIILALIPVLGINGVIQTRSMKGFSADAKMMYEQASQVATDAVGSIRTVASFCSEEKVMQLYRSKCEGPMRAGKRLGAISGVGFGVSSFLLYAFQATCFYAGARLVKGGHITFADVFRVFFASTVSSLTVSHSSSFTSDTTKAKRAAASVFSIIDAESKIDPSDESGTTLDNVKGEIQLRHTVALVGESGSGKSTVISLLLRFYDPEAGRITIDGTEIHQLQLKWLRQQMGLVSQEPALFNDTIRANIAYGKGGEATEAEIIAAAELANAHKFICSLQQGYDTMVGERGVQLSGGQKQRIAIARAIVKSPKILLLDEATSALDAESERVVQAALDKVMVNRTTVVVAHRLSTIRNADVIAVVKNGVIAEKGRHESLIKIKDGAYASLVALHSSGGQTA
ncbi:ABC transporter B member 11 [Turnera subulata]|uniref:ABC transporter B member 11 n=1 Tax=Turnera subulata TaxID=218843 RepID=A0A9Q0FPJ6_9ROSI|nr:ABC transporter B member 11 [Turnera subulata]